MTSHGKQEVGKSVGPGPASLGPIENGQNEGLENACGQLRKPATTTSSSQPGFGTAPVGDQHATTRVAPLDINGERKAANPRGSWADKVRASSANSRFSLDSGLHQDHGCDVYTLPDEFIEDNFKDWTRCLVGFIPGSPFPFHAARTIALREWKPYGIQAVFSYEGFFIFRFQNEENVHEVLADGPWLFGGKFMMLQQWHACFVFDKSKLTKVPVWVKLKGLPFTLWSNKALSFVASIIGKPLSCDRATHEKSRLSYARVCVEVDASRPYVHSFALKCKLSSDPIRVGVEYEWKPQRCPKCCVYGHNCEATTMVEKQGKGVPEQRDTGEVDKGNSVLVGTSGPELQEMECKDLRRKNPPSLLDMQVLPPLEKQRTDQVKGPGMEGEQKLEDAGNKQSLLDALTLVSKPALVNSVTSVEQRDIFTSTKGTSINVIEGEVKLSRVLEVGDPIFSSGEAVMGNKETGKVIEDTSSTGYAIVALPREPAGNVDTKQEESCTINTTVPFDSGSKKGLTTPESKGSRVDKGKAIAYVDGLSDTAGSWADKVRKTPNDPVSDEKFEGSTPPAGAYNLRPQRPKRKGKMKRGILPH